MAVWQKPWEQLSFWLIILAWWFYTGVGPVWDKNHSPGLPYLFFSSLCLVASDHNLSSQLFDDDPVVRITYAFALLCRVLLLGGSTFSIVHHGPDKIESAWLLLFPLPIVAMGLPAIIKHIQRPSQSLTSRIATALTTVGVFSAHFVKQIDVGKAVYQHFQRLWPTNAFHSTLPSAFLGAAMLLHFLHAETLPTQSQQTSISEPSTLDEWTLTRSPVSTNALAWATGLALCAGSIDNSLCRATLASVGISMALFIKSLPPFRNKLFGLNYRTYTVLFYRIQLVTVCLCLSYHLWDVCYPARHDVAMKIAKY